MRGVFSIIFSFMIISGFGQNLSQCIKYGDENFAIKDYYGASIYYEKAMEIDSGSIDILWKYAESLRLYNNYEKAEYYYAKVFKKGSGRIHPTSVFYLAQMQKNNGKYRESGKTWRKVKRYLGKKKGSYYRLKSEQEIKACSWAYRAVKDSAEIKIHHPDERLNTVDSEFSPLFNDDKLYFSSLRPALIDNEVVTDDNYVIRLYRADSLENYNFKTEKGFKPSINTIGINTGEGCFSSDKKHFYFTRCLPDQPCEIWYASFKNNTWGEAKKLNGVNQSTFSSVQPYAAIINNKEYLFFSSNQKGTLGGLDIWYGELKNGKVSNIKNAGKAINSLDNEISPYYNDSTNELYFSSEWHFGLGGMDIFKSKNENFKFGKPENIKPPYNSPANDMYFKMADNKQKAALASNRLGSYFAKGPTCCNDIYLIEYPTEPQDTSPYKSLIDLNKYLPVTLYFHNDRPNPNTTDTITDLNYLTTYNRYTDMLGKYKKEYGNGLNVVQKEKSNLDMENFFYNKVDKGVEDLKIFTELLYKELEKGLKVEVTVQGYASPLAKTDYNVNLTFRRVSSMVNFMKEWNNGVLKPYFNGTATNGGSLSIIKIPFGEYTANQTISDNPNDKKNSVYSIGAASERKIEIQSVQLAKTDSIYAEMHFDKEIYDFGKVSKTDSLSYTFKFKNIGNKDLSIKDLEYDSNIISIEFDNSNSYRPNDSGEITIKVNPNTLTSFNTLEIIANNNGFPEKKILRVTFEVTE